MCDQIGRDRGDEIGWGEQRVRWQGRWFSVRMPAAIILSTIAVIWMSDCDVVVESAKARRGCGREGTAATSLAVSPDGTMIATTNTAGQVALRTRGCDWNVERMVDVPGYHRSLSFLHNSRLLAVASDEPGIQLWNVDLARVVRKLPVPLRGVRHLRCAPDGRTVAVATALDGTILVYDLIREEVRARFQHRLPVMAISFSPDGRVLASAGREDSWITLRDLETHVVRRLMTGARCGALSLVYSPDGNFLATVQDFECHARLWDLSTDRVCREFESRQRVTNSVAFSPDGQTVAIVGKGKAVELWQVATGQHLIDLDGDSLWLRDVAFTRDGAILFATADDDDVRFWDFDEVRRAWANGSMRGQGFVSLANTGLRSVVRR